MPTIFSVEILQLSVGELQLPAHQLF